MNWQCVTLNGREGKKIKARQYTGWNLLQKAGTWMHVIDSGS